MSLWAAFHAAEVSRPARNLMNGMSFRSRGPGGNRTRDLRIKSPLLYRIELRARRKSSSSHWSRDADSAVTATPAPRFVLRIWGPSVDTSCMARSSAGTTVREMVALDRLWIDAVQRCRGNPSVTLNVYLVGRPKRCVLMRFVQLDDMQDRNNR